MPPNSTRHRGTTAAAAAARIAPALAAGFGVLLWHLASLRYPAFILPGPVAVAAKFWERTIDGSLLQHAAVTASEAIPGLLCGALLALAIGYPTAHWHIADRLLSPLVVATQGVPLIAIAPLIFIWFGSGHGAKVLVCTIIVFFPIVVNVTTGLRGTPQHLRDVFAMLGASRSATFFKLELPHALPFVFAGLRTAAALSMIGALTGEFLSSNQGLGFLINQSTGLYDTPLTLVAILATIATSLTIHGSVRAVERAFLRSSSIR